ncbi:dsRBD fold-containing protein [Nocardioides sp. MAHUQ-72]|uniref:dsRBD fold-containing protein n=1 Tax=unclassified Nocardioides TaxID=2615069 RepID=UPI003610989F
MHTKTWTVEIFIGEQEGRTHAEARLSTEKSARPLSGEGTARLNPTDANVPEIGDELAASRALSALAHRLLDVAAEDIGAVTEEHVRLYR